MLPDSALTRCPECQTVFAVDGEDLARAGGRVRCGECLGVFDAIANALPADESPQAEVQTETASAAEPVTAPDDPPENAPEIIDEPAAHTETASSLSWTLLEPIDEEQDPAEIIGNDAPDMDPQASEIDELPTSITDEAAAEASQAHVDMQAHDSETPEAQQHAPIDDDEVSATRGVTTEESVDAPPATEFRFGDDTPPEMLEAELEALLDDEREHTTSQTFSDEPEFDLTTTMSDVGDADLFDTDWDDLLGELDDTADSVVMTLIDDDSAEAPPLDFELADSDRTGRTSSVDLDLSRADAALAAPESIDAVTLTADTGYRDAPAFDVFEPPQDAGESDPDTTTPPGSEPELDESESESASADEAANSESDADLIAAQGEEIELAVDEQVSEQLAPEAPGTPEIADTDDNIAAESAEPDIDPAPVDPAVANAEVEARLAAYHAALAAVGDGNPAGSTAPGEDDASFDVNALTDMFSAVDILASGAAAEAAQKTDESPGTDEVTETESDTASHDEDSGQDTEEPDRSEDEETGQAQDETPEDSATADDLAAKDSTAEETVDDSAEDSVEADTSPDSETNSIESDADVLSAAMDAAEQGEVIILSGDPSELEPAADAFAESMILSPDPAPTPTRRRLWLGLSAAALVALCLQTIHSYRGEIATLQPWGGYLSGAYALFGQSVTPHWNATQMCVERSGGALNADNRLDIETVFSNHGDKTMPMPVLKLRITDAYSDTLAGVVIQPAQYLPATDPRTELRPGEQATALATLDYSEPRLDGFEVSLCYPGDDGALRCAVRCEDDNAKR